MRIVKKYPNRKLYDTTDKSYISMDRLSEIIKEGEEVQIIDNKSGKDITAIILPQLLAKKKKEKGGEVPTSVLVQLLRKGGGTLVDYAKKYAALWQNAFTMAEDEVDKLVHVLVKDRELSESEGNKLKKEITSYAVNMRTWIGEKIDQRIDEMLKVMNLASKEQVLKLSNKLDQLAEKVERIENSLIDK